MSRPEASPAILFGRPAWWGAGVLTLAVAVIFLAFPETDMVVAKTFYTGGNGFLHRDGPVHVFVDTWGRPGLKLLVIAVLVLACVSLLSGGRFPKWRRRAIVFMGLSYAIGPALLVNAALKNVIGRARPKHIEALGGDKMFSAAFVQADQCATNCSFVSGDVAFVAAGLGFALLLEGGKRQLAIGVCLGLTAMTGYYRMGVGAHFLSDVVLAAMFCFTITLALHHLVFSRSGGARPRP